MKCQTPAATMLISAIGSMNFQAKFMSWSMRRRGSVPRTQMNSRMISASSFAKNQNHDGTQFEERERRVPAAEEQRDAQAADGEHARGIRPGRTART